MEWKVFWGQNLIWMILMLGQLNGYKSCIQKERMALLDLKEYITSRVEETDLEFTLPSWTNDTKSNCCQWEGIKCNQNSRRIIEISTGKSSVIEDSLLNLSLLHPFDEVCSLNLSGDGIHGFSALFDDVEGYRSLRRLRNLEILDLSENGFNNSIFPFLNAATSIKTLILRDNFMYGPFSGKEFINLTNLELLDLSGNNFDSFRPTEGRIYCKRDYPRLLVFLFHSQNLTDLLPYNRVGSICTISENIMSIFHGVIPCLVAESSQELKALDLSSNGFSDSRELEGICELKNLQELDVSKNNISGQFPLCVTSLIGLKVLDLSSNQLTGKVPSALGNLKSLEYLSLVDNNFEGFFSLDTLANLSKLKVVTLSSQSNSLQVDMETSWTPTFQLSVISLRSCNLEEVPRFLLHQKELRQVDLSHNKISGLFPSWLLENNTKLDVLLLQSNSFMSFRLPRAAHSLLFLDVSVNGFNQYLPENIGWMLPHLRHMDLSANSFQGNLPLSLGNMASMYFLDISNNSFHGELPRIFVMGCYSMIFLKLSHNKLSGEIFPESTNFTDLSVLFMDNNKFTGKIGESLKSLRSLKVLDMSSNYLVGIIPSWIGEFVSLYGLFLSDNLLEGEIPVSVFNMSYLGPVDLSANKLSGAIPPRLNSIFGVVLNLQDNNLTGNIPKTLLENVVALDLRNNKLSGNIPEFINTRNISILLVKGNNLTGPIPRKVCDLSSISLLDLSNNGLNGPIPSCLSNTSFGKGKGSEPYDFDFLITFGGIGMEKDGVTPINLRRYYNSQLAIDPFTLEYTTAMQTKIKFAVKKRYDTYMGGSLKYLFGLDFSENEFTGDIPEELGDLLELNALNLSRNDLSGAIPESFSRAKNMESLDLSFNSLQGRIQSKLTEMSSLVVFNVSYNNLSGVIPQGRQFNTFDESSYIGNPLLCGQPTNISCNNINNLPEEPKDGVEDDEDAVFKVSFYQSFAIAYATIVLGIVASLFFNSHWNRAWFSVVDAFIHKMKFCHPK